MADCSTDDITAQNDNYENAKAALVAAIPEGTKLIAIRKDIRKSTHKTTPHPEWSRCTDQDSAPPKFPSQQASAQAPSTTTWPSPPPPNLRSGTTTATQAARSPVTRITAEGPRNLNDTIAPLPCRRPDPL